MSMLQPVPKEECITGTAITDVNDFMYKLGFQRFGNVYQIKTDDIPLLLKKLGFRNGMNDA